MPELLDKENAHYFPNHFLKRYRFYKTLGLYIAALASPPIFRLVVRCAQPIIGDDRRSSRRDKNVIDKIVTDGSTGVVPVSDAVAGQFVTASQARSRMPRASTNRARS